MQFTENYEAKWKKITFFERLAQEFHFKFSVITQTNRAFVEIP